MADAQKLYNKIKKEEELIDIIGPIVNEVCNSDIMHEITISSATSTFENTFKKNRREIDRIFAQEECPDWIEPLISNQVWIDKILKIYPEYTDSMFLKFILSEINHRNPKNIKYLPCFCTTIQELKEWLPGFTEKISRFNPEFNQSLDRFIDMMISDDSIIAACASSLYRGGDHPFIIRVWERMREKKYNKESELFITFMLKFERCPTKFIKVLIKDYSSPVTVRFINEAKSVFTQDKETTLVKAMENDTKRYLTKYIIKKKLSNENLISQDLLMTIYNNSFIEKPSNYQEVNVLLRGPDNYARKLKLCKERFYAVGSIHKIQKSITESKKAVPEDLNILFEINYLHPDLRRKIADVIGTCISIPNQSKDYYAKIFTLARCMMPFNIPFDIIGQLTRMPVNSSQEATRDFISKFINLYKPPYSYEFTCQFLNYLFCEAIFKAVFPGKETDKNYQKTAVFQQVKELLTELSKEYPDMRQKYGRLYYFV